MQNCDIKKILELVKEKDSSGFELLYQHYFRFLFSVAYSVLNNQDDSYDVIQSVMIRLYRLDQSLFPVDHELSWLRTVVKNEALMYLRREKSAVPLEEAADFPVSDQRIEDFADMDAFQKLIAPLNERQKKVVSMKILGGHDPQGNCSNTVRSHRNCTMDLRHIHQETTPFPDCTYLTGTDFWRRVWVSSGEIFSGGVGGTRRHRDQQHSRCAAGHISLADRILGIVSVFVGRLHPIVDFFRPDPNKALGFPHQIR